MDEELRIIPLLKQGVGDAYKYIYKHHYTLMCKVAFEYLHDDYLATHIADEVIFSLWDKRETLNITVSLRSYLLRAVRNRCLNYLQLEYNKREIRFDTPGISPGQLEYLSASDYPLGILLEKELETTILNAIEKLPSETRAVFQLSRFEDKKYQEIADELGISVNTVKYHIKNALALLYNELGKYLLMILILFLL